MSRYYLFALNHKAINDHQGHKPLETILGEALAALSDDTPYGWCPREVSLNGEVLLKRLALLDYDDATLAIEVDGLSSVVVKWKQFQDCDRKQFTDRLSGGALTAPPDLNTLFQEQLAAIERDPAAEILSRLTSSQETEAELSDVISTIYSVKEEVISLLQDDVRGQKKKNLRGRTGAALLDLASNINAPTSDIEGINYTPAIRKAIVVRPGPPSLCVWVFNGLHVVENFDERHWRTLERKKFISA